MNVAPLGSLCAPALLMDRSEKTLQEWSVWWLQKQQKPLLLDTGGLLADEPPTSFWPDPGRLGLSLKRGEQHSRCLPAATAPQLWRNNPALCQHCRTTPGGQQMRMGLHTSFSNKALWCFHALSLWD